MSVVRFMSPYGTRVAEIEPNKAPTVLFLSIGFGALHCVSAII